MSVQTSPAEQEKMLAQKKAEEMKPYTDMLANIKMQQGQLMAQQGNRPGVALTEQSAYEKKAGVSPVSYEGTRDVRTGQLLDEYKIDPYQGEALQALKKQAFAQGDSPWAKMQLEKQALEQTGAKDATTTSGAQAIAQAQANLMRQGGLSSGARTRMAMQGAKDLARQQQLVERQGIEQRLGIGAKDIDQKKELLSNFGNLETQAQGANIGQAASDINRKALFDMARYKEQMQAWGSEKTADAQRNAGGGGKK